VKSLTARLGLQRWSSDEDVQTREEFDGAHAILDALVVGYDQGAIADRPAATEELQGFLYVVNVNTGGGTVGATYWCVGAAGWLHLNPATGFDFGEDADISISRPGDVAAAGTTGEVADAGHVHGREEPYTMLFLMGA
jgi:hypothetical protein